MDPTLRLLGRLPSPLLPIHRDENLDFQILNRFSIDYISTTNAIKVLSTVIVLRSLISSVTIPLCLHRLVLSLNNTFVAMAICWLTMTVSFSPLLESVVLASRLILIDITIFSEIYGKDYSSPSVFFTIPSMDWCFFVNILEVPPKIVWRCLYRVFIFLLVMEENLIEILLDIYLGFVEDLRNTLVEDCVALKNKTHSGRSYMIQMDLLEERHRSWRYMLSMVAMEKHGIRITLATRWFVPHRQVISHYWDRMERKTKPKIVKMTMIRKFWYHNVYISELSSEASGFIMRCVIRRFSQEMLPTHIIRIRARLDMKENNGFNNPLASKAYLRKASSIHFSLCIFLNLCCINMLM